MEQNKISIEKLFNQKKYKEIINIVENKIDKKYVTSQILNILGVCKLLKGTVLKNDLVEAIKSFEKAY